MAQRMSDKESAYSPDIPKGGRKLGKHTKTYVIQVFQAIKEVRDIQSDITAGN